MSGDSAGIRTRTEFMWLAKYDGDRTERSESSGDDVRDRLTWLQCDLTDPKCVEIVAGREGQPPSVWRKV